MPKPADRRRRKKPGQTDPLARLLDAPHLAQIVPRLAPEVLHHVIRERGLEACAGLIAASTPQQLASVLDLDLWQTSPTRNDQFDASRFGTWLEALMNEGEAVAVGVLEAIDPDLAATGLSRYVRVFDPGVFQPTASSDDESPDVDVARSASLECEIGGYVVRARTSQAWDAIVGTLVTLADDRPDVFHNLMQGCRRVSNSTPEIDGLDDLLLEPEQLLHDVSIERERRRTQAGYLTAGDARAFLQMARQRRSAATDDSSSMNGIATAYFRALDAEIALSTQSSRTEEDREPSSNDPEVARSIDAVLDLLTQSGLTPAQPRALLGPAADDVRRVTPLEPLLAHVHDTDETAYFVRNRELAFLANALIAGCSVYSRPLTPQEAWSAVAGVCNIGLEVLSTTLPDDFLVNHDVVTPFEVGWRQLHNDVSMFVARHLIAILQELQTIDTPVQEDLYRLRRELERNCDAGTPWLSQDALEPLAIVDMPAWASLCGLLSECPVLPAALTAILENRGGSFDATAFEPFTTRTQIHKVHEFSARLRNMLFQ